MVEIIILEKYGGIGLGKLHAGKSAALLR